MQEGETRRLFSRFLGEKTPFAIMDNPYNLARILNSSRSSKHAKPLDSGQKPFNGVLRKLSRSQNDKTLYCFSLILKNLVTSLAKSKNNGSYFVNFYQTVSSLSLLHYLQCCFHIDYFLKT